MPLTLALLMHDQLTLCDVVLDGPTPRVIERTRLEAPPGGHHAINLERDLAAWADDTGFYLQRAVTSARPGPVKEPPTPQLTDVNTIIHRVCLRDGVLFAGGYWEHVRPGVGFFTSRVAFGAIDLDRARLKWVPLRVPQKGRSRGPQIAELFTIGSTLHAIDDAEAPARIHRYDVSQPRAPNPLPMIELRPQARAEVVFGVAVGERAVALLWHRETLAGDAHRITLHDKATFAEVASFWSLTPRREDRHYEGRLALRDIAFSGDRLLVGARRSGVLVVDEPKVHALLDAALAGGEPPKLQLHEQARRVPVAGGLATPVFALPTTTHCLAGILDADGLTHTHVIDLSAAR